VLTRTVSQNQNRRNQLVELQPSQAEFAHDLPGIPVLPKTLLLLDLLVQEPCIDLREMSQLVLSDLGAALQILRRAGQEYGNAEDRPTRMEDCIADLGLEACLKAVSEQMVPCDSWQQEIEELWVHSREIAQLSMMVADEMLPVNPEEAYLAGLFHAIGLLPQLLGWREAGESDAALLGLRFATRWSLPHSVTEFFREIHFTGYPVLWSGIVREAHHRANRSSTDCPFEQALRPYLLGDENRQPGPAGLL
jgi:hypothetical protein